MQLTNVEAKRRWVRCLLRRLDGTQEINAYALALILTEMKFRGILRRICEIAWCAVLIYCFRKEPKLTVGACQVRFEFWGRRFGHKNIRVLLATFDSLSSYNVCCDYLSRRPTADIRALLVDYNGRPSLLYARNFHAHLSLVVSELRRYPLGDRRLGSACSELPRA